MTIQELIEELLRVPENKRNLPIYVYDYEIGDNIEISGISLYDGLAEHSEENMLSVDINSNFY